jgi:hyaluronan synthase
MWDSRFIPRPRRRTRPASAQIQLTPVSTGDSVARTLSELVERYGVPEEKLADALGWQPHEVAARRGAAGVDATAPAAPVMQEPGWIDRVIRWLAGAYLLALLGAVVYYKSAFIAMLTVSPLLSTYGLIVVFYISSRFFFSAFYRACSDHGIEPHVAIVMPGFNEEDAIARSLRSLLELAYPADKLEIVAVNDGSTDATLAEMRRVAATANGRVRVIDFPQNRGKRAAMAAGIRATEADIVAFVDSDSVLDPHAMRILVQGFHDPKVGGICGHADVLNVRENWITKMQAVRYFVAFSVNKAAESVFSTVTCCSGCFSAYRRAAIMPHLDWWENQKFLGRDSTFGDDRSLTNCVLRDWKVRYESRAISHTIVPNNFRQFMRQQLRWKRSWTRESLILARFVWRKNPIPAGCAYIGMALPIIAPVVAAHAIFMMPVAGAGAPVLYLVGVYTMSVCYGLYYAARRPRYDYLWIYGIAFCFFYLAFLLWQTYWAIATTRSVSWGTRPSSAGLPIGEPT